MSTTNPSRAFAWLNDKRRVVALPKNETRWLRRYAQFGAVIVTRANGERVAMLGTPTAWSYGDTKSERANAFEPRARRGKNGANGVDVLGRRVPTRKPAID
jgi:putative SOS response-associated peptidase YedK